MHFDTYNFNTQYGIPVFQASEVPPTSIMIQYSAALSHQQRRNVEKVVNYWLGATAILDRKAPALTAWTGDNTLHVFAPFASGNFDGNLMHRDAIGDGDDQFTIGLAKLFIEGYTPLTRRGQGVRPGPMPRAISFVYGANRQPARLTEMAWRNYENAPVMHMQLLTTGVIR